MLNYRVHTLNTKRDALKIIIGLTKLRNTSLLIPSIVPTFLATSPFFPIKLQHKQSNITNIRKCSTLYWGLAVVQISSVFVISFLYNVIDCKIMLHIKNVCVYISHNIQTYLNVLTSILPTVPLKILSCFVSLMY